MSTTSTFTHTPAAVIQQLLVTLGVGVLAPDGTNSNWPIAVGTEPNDPSNFITIYDTDPRYGGRISISGEVTEYPGLQIRVRADRHEVGYPKIHAIAVALSESVLNEYVNIDGTQYQVYSIRRESGPASLGRETPTSQRRLFTLNVTATIRQLV